MGGFRRGMALAAVAAASSVVAAQVAVADGTETLGAPSISIADGTGVVADGTGLVMQPGTIDLDVPSGASVEQVLLYWNGFHSRPDVGADDAITVDGVEVSGTLIGGPTLFFAGHHSSTYRADITSLGLVTDGLNSLSVDGADFDRVNNGAGIMVIYDDGSDAELGLVDGQDLAYHLFKAPLDTTVAQTFTFAPEPVDRVANLSMFFSSVEGQDHPGERPSVVRVTVNGVVTEIIDELMSGDGAEWDTLDVIVDVPAGADSVTVQALSHDRRGTGNRPASFAWTAAALSIPTTPAETPGGEGCTPGYWKNHTTSWVGYSSGDAYGTVFGVTPSDGSITLQQAAARGGGGERALLRHSVAALLNAANPGVSYGYSVGDVIAIVQGAYATGDFEGAKNRLEAENELGCPLN